MNFLIIFNAVALFALSFIVFLMLRQIGFLSAQVPQIGARNDGSGPRIGENLTRQLSFVSDMNDRSSVIIFISMSCSICGTIVDSAKSLQKTWGDEFNFFLILDDETDRLDIERKFGSLEWAQVVFQPKLRSDLGISLVPYAISINRENSVLGSGLINNISHLESLLELSQNQQSKEITYHEEKYIKV